MNPRAAGVLLHPTSLPSGRMDGDAYRFVDLIATAGFTLWQVLPLQPPGHGGSPYAAHSAFAGNLGLLPAGRTEIDPGEFAGEPEYAAFRDEAAAWLEDWALFAAIRDVQGGTGWWEWPKALRDREPARLDAVRAELADAMERHRVAQWLFDREWTALRQYAADRGVRIVGDIPIWVALDSADAWAQRGLFKLGEDGMPRVVAGVPPDLFSATGQRWGNPIYDWDVMRRDGFRWWRERVRWTLRQVDVARVDHFRGFVAAWEIPVESAVATTGAWAPGPGMELFEALGAGSGPLPLIVEDLGIITPDVVELRELLGLPGMAILQYAFDGQPANPYVPHNLVARQVVYTGTHDNQTTVGWLAQIDEATRGRLSLYTGQQQPVVEDVIRLLLASVCEWAVLPMQDILELGDDARMNTPASDAGNWGWRFEWDQVRPERFAELRELMEVFGRLPRVDSRE